MKRWIWILVSAIGLQNAASASTPHQKLVCRMDDPFLFCTKGCDTPDYNWKPLDPISGTWTPVAPYCPFPTPTSTNYCEGWTMTAITALEQYQSICPGALKQGQWKGTKQPEMVPFKH
ncbi:hypothetical protein M0D46_09800 [Xanthomonas prunicola]|uniref:hypothetical protein n=1 Tax=Xanthomonas prunicola TaxID=2053930 RepID=UPI0021B428DA|nr:hypothetical protein [Xanthomonas prunicola]UXA71248.1 hypothetical protein M0D46_09800 [Xanthomonas prunicola]